MPQVSDSGEEAYLADTIKAPFEEFEVKGHSEQDGDPTPESPVDIKSCGENVNEFHTKQQESYTTNGITFTLNADGTSVTANGTATADAYFALNNVTPFLKIGENYCLNCTSNSDIQSSSSTYRAQVAYVKPNSTKYQRSDGTFVYTPDGTETAYHFALVILNGMTCDNLALYPKLEQGTVATPWSPYGMGSINERIVNKNLYKMDTVGTYTINGVTIKTNGDGSVTFNGTATNNIYAYVTEADGYVNTGNAPLARLVTIPANTALTLSGSGTNVKCRLRNQTDGVNDSDGDITKIYTSEKQVSIMFYIVSGKTVNETLYPMLELSSSKTDYVPHAEQTYTIPTQQPMRSIGEVRDGFVKVNGVWNEVHNINRKALKNYNYTLSSITQENLFRVSSSQMNDIKAEAQIVGSNIFIGIASATGRVDGNIYYNYGNGALDIICNSYNNTTDFVAMLTEKNGYVDYILATPTYLPCTQLQSDILDSLTEDTYTYRGGTYISSDDEVKARIKVSGLRDLNVLFNN